MSDQTTHLMLPFLQAGQAQKHVTLNESLLRLDALVMLAPLSATTTAQPGSPADGDIYILPSGKTGAEWSGMSAHALAYYRDGVWEQIAPREGFLAYVKDVDTLKAYDGAAWNTVTTTGAALVASANAFVAAQAITIASGQTALTLQLNDDGAAYGPAVSLYRNSASATAADLLGIFEFLGKDNAGNMMTYARCGARIEDATDGSEDASIYFSTRVAAGFGERGYVGQGLVIGAPTGGDKGAGTINAVAVYDDNTLLTCGPVELLNSGKIDLEKWDALAPNIEHPPEFEDVVEEIETANGEKTQRIVGRRQIRPSRVEVRTHEAMRHFAAMLEEGFDPRDPANFCARLKADGAVPGLITEPEWRAMLDRGEKPNTGAALTRTFLALDNLAVAFSALVERVEALESVATGVRTR